MIDLAWYFSVLIIIFISGPLTEIMDAVTSEKDTLVNDERSSKASDNIEDGEDMSATNLTPVDAPSGISYCHNYIRQFIHLITTYLIKFEK